ncbi:MAG: S8 family serine peptidase, partial [Clostridium sp.]
LITLTIPSTARKAITVAYYNEEKDTLVSASGNGFNSNDLVNPDIITAGINVITISKSGGKTVASGSSVATAIVSGCCCLILQWGIVNKNDVTMYSTKVKSYLIYGADRARNDKYPNRFTGYGKLDILKTFNIIGGIYRNKNIIDDVVYEEKYIKYEVNNLYIRIPINMVKENEVYGN